MRTAIFGVVLAVVVVGLTGGALLAQPPGAGAADDEARWAIVQEYLEQQATWQAASGVSWSDLPDGAVVEDWTRRAEELLGAPDSDAAVAAARAIVAGNGPRTADAAVFLIERGLDPVNFAQDILRNVGSLLAELGSAPDALGAGILGLHDPTWASLIAHTEPDWAVVEDFQAQQRAWFSSRADAPEIGFALADGGPSAIRAVAAARAILNAEGGHPRTVEAAEFLVGGAYAFPSSSQHLVAGARALVGHAPEYDGWADALRRLDETGRQPFGDALIDEFLAELAADADDPALRAGARYYVALGLMRQANNLNLTLDERARSRERALAEADGLSRGAEDEPFDQRADAPTFAEAESYLLDLIRHATVGGRLPDLVGRRLDGAEAPLSAYRGRVLLINFWATWCPPCIDALPELRALVADLPADDFALLAISGDEELAAVTDLLEREPLPWDNWYAGAGNAGRGSEIQQRLAVRGFPTYLLVDRDGLILANGMTVELDRLRCMAERAVAGDDPYGCRPAWLP